MGRQGMADIDAPEKDQPYGREARAMLTAALDGKDVVMRRVDTDTHGRIVVHAWIANLDINREVVARGSAWFYAEYAHDNCLYPVENEARNAKRGLWALPREQRIEPWIWRQNKRDAAAAHGSTKALAR
jgi:endonuclease YncB( thermonuclease family)